jgi:hypothetical protein
MSNPTLEFFKREREAMKRRNGMTDEAFRLWLREQFKDNPELVSGAVADFVAERIRGTKP